jgi:hypothetical protein
MRDGLITTLEIALMRLAILATFSLLFIAADPLEGDKFVEKADERFEQSMARAQEAYGKAAGDAYETRLKTYRTILAAATKAGDFDRANAVKERIAELEAEKAAIAELVPGKKKRTRPKNVLRFGGHEYALFEENVVWHTAKKRCEDLGGHLATLETPEEQAFILDACRAAKQAAWLGVTNEPATDKWVWITGEPVKSTAGWALDDHFKEYFARAAAFWPATDGINDHDFRARIPFLCEWDD